MIEFIKYLWKEFIQTLLVIYDKFTQPLGDTDIPNFEVYFRPEGIFFQDYLFTAASVYPSGLVSYTHIQEVILSAAPPEVRTKNGEVLFIPAELKKELKEAALTNQIPLVSRVDVWSYILDPFLDTEFTPEQQEQTLRLLEENGIPREECQKLREFVAEAMLAYNFTSGLWEWTHLGLCDVLAAFSGNLAGHRHKLSEVDFKNFYYQAMEVAHRAKILS